jgi:hypothetical protein
VVPDGPARLARVDCPVCGAVVFVRRSELAAARAPGLAPAPVESAPPAERSSTGAFVIGTFAVCALALVGVLFVAPHCRGAHAPPAEEAAAP